MEKACKKSIEIQEKRKTKENSGKNKDLLNGKQEKQTRTEITERNMDFLSGKAKTPQQLVAFLKEGALFCDFGCVLKEVYPKPDLAARLAHGLSEINNGDYEKNLRKVHNWINGKNIPQNRELLFQICFVLNLEEKTADRVLAAASDTGIHYRNPGELAYAYALRNEYTYMEAVRLKNSVLELLNMEQCKEQSKKKYESMEKQESGRVYTNQIRDVFGQVSSEAELFDFFKEHGKKLGVLHETAYQKFIELLSCLQEPKGSLEMEERKFTMEEVVQSYIRMNVPQSKVKRDDTLLQRLVKKYWPGTASIINMRNRKEDVSRKVIILLYLITEDFDRQEEVQETDYYLEDVEEEPDTLLEIRLEKMNLFLSSYGMNCLDRGSPFDFLALYAMKTQKEEYVSDRMEKVLNILFETEDAEK